MSDIESNDDTGGGGLKFAMVCSSNMNRSMEAHKQLKKKNLRVTSYGVGAMVRLPGPNGTQAVFEFGTPYREIFNTLTEGGTGGQWYRNNGLLGMVERNMGVKDHPERWQELPKFEFNIVFCFEERVFELLMEDVNKREVEWNEELHPMHIINLEVQDNPKEALIGAQIVLDFCLQSNELAKTTEDFENSGLSSIVDKIEQKYKRSLLHMTVFC